MCDVTVCSCCVCCVVGQNPSQTSVWCPMVTAQLANMTGDTYFFFVIFLNFIILSFEPIKRCNCTKFKLLYSRSALVAEVLRDPIAKQYLIKRIGGIIRKELVLMCSDKTNSILGSQLVCDLKGAVAHGDYFFLKPV